MKFIALLPLVWAVTEVPGAKVEPTVLGSNSRVSADTAAVVSADGSITIDSSRAVAAPSTSSTAAVVTPHENVPDLKREGAVDGHKVLSHQNDVEKVQDSQALGKVNPDGTGVQEAQNVDHIF